MSLDYSIKIKSVWTNFIELSLLNLPNLKSKYKVVGNYYRKS